MKRGSYSISPAGEPYWSEPKMKKKALSKLFPHASQAVRLLNAVALHQSAAKANKGVKRRGVKNKGEREFGLILEAQKRQGEILRYEFEGITLRWFSGDEILTYTPDYVVFCRAYIKLIELKGAFVGGHFERAIERYRHAKTYWGDVFQFELHQKTKSGWKQKG